MKVILFGASGMLGQGVLREALRADDVSQVLVVGRTALQQDDPKLRQLVRADLFDYSGLEADLSGYDACLFCLGVSASEIDEAGYVRINHDLPLAAAKVLSRLNPQMVFVYVSGAGTDSSEQGRVMWARVKGRTENALQRLPFRGVYLLRPAAIQPMHGEQSKTRSYRLFYRWLGWTLPLLRTLFPHLVLTTEQIGRAMLATVRRGAPRPVLEVRDIAELGR